MSNQTLEAGVREALFDLQRYFSDRLAPLMVIDSVELLLQYQPELVAREIQGWVAGQFRGPSRNVAVSDYLYHAMKKIHMMSEFDLVDQMVLSDYLTELTELVVGLCPDRERDRLRSSLGRLGQADADLTPPVEIVHRQGGERKPHRPADGVGEDVSRGIRRFSLLVERLERDAPSSIGLADQEVDAARAELARQAITAGAVAARTAGDFEQHMHRLRQAGVDAGTGQLFRALGQSLPGWALPPSWAAEGGGGVPPSAPARAMRRIISVAPNQNEGLKRFDEMVRAAIEQFNTGFLVQAMTMFELAEKIAVERKLKPASVDSVRNRARAALSEEQLRRFADKPEKHEALRAVLCFFPNLTPRGLLDGLDGEMRRDRRKLLLALLEVHGAPARAEAFERLVGAAADREKDPEGFYLRNLVYLLRRVPRPADVPVKQELDLLLSLSEVGNPPLVLKEVVGALGTLKHARAEKGLMRCLQRFEHLLMTESRRYEKDELLALVDRTASTLARYGTPNTSRTVFNHALLRDPHLGDTMARLDELGSQDLAGDTELVTLMVDTLREELPKKVLGLTVHKGGKDAGHLVKALTGTPAPAVRQVFEEIVRRFGEEGVGKAAAEGLRGFGARVRPGEGAGKALSGDLELFGLPNLLQTLSDAQVTGKLALSDGEGRPIGSITFEAGKIRGCHAGILRGEDALYQLFEKPRPGSFVFTSRSEGVADRDAGSPPIEVLPAVLEALRRYDEFQQARALVPDEAALEPAGPEPTPPADEEDGAFLKSLWSKVSAGASAATCEETLPADAYRIRRVLAHWLEQGALRAA